MNVFIDALLGDWQLNLTLVEALMKDVPADHVTRQPGVVNHPVWTLAHLRHYHPAMLALIQNHPVEDPGSHPDAPRYDEGSTPVDAPAGYTSHLQSLDAYRDGHGRVVDALAQMPQGHLARPPRLERWAATFGTIGLTLQYLMIVYESHNVGQLMAWQRAAGLTTR